MPEDENTGAAEATENQQPAQANNDKADDKQDDANKADEKTQMIPKFDPFAESEHEPTVVSDPDTYTLTPCCCCLCACSHDRVGDATCFGCLPIRCGVMFIAIQIFLLAVILITATFFQLLNEYLPWWFPFITLLLLIPAALAASFMVYFFARDNRTTRGNMFKALVLSIISVSLWCIWQLIFFLAIYKRDTVYSGIGAANDESNYHTTPKRTYLFTVLAETAILLTFLTYYTCVANEYVDLMNDKYTRQKKEEEAKKEAEEKAEKARKAGK